MRQPRWRRIACWNIFRKTHKACREESANGRCSDSLGLIRIIPFLLKLYFAFCTQYRGQIHGHTCFEISAVTGEAGAYLSCDGVIKDGENMVVLGRKKVVSV